MKEGQLLYRGLIRLKEQKEFGPYKVVFNDLRYWITLNLVKETGIGFFFWCSLLGLLGLLIRFLDPDRKLFFVFEKGKVSVVAYSKHFEGILKEQTKALVKTILNKGGS